VHEDVRCGCADFAYWHNEPVALLPIEEFNDPSCHAQTYELGSTLNHAASVRAVA